MLLDQLHHGADVGTGQINRKAVSAPACDLLAALPFRLGLAQKLHPMNGQGPPLAAADRAAHSANHVLGFLPIAKAHLSTMAAAALESELTGIARSCPEGCCSPAPALCSGDVFIPHFPPSAPPVGGYRWQEMEA